MDYADRGKLGIEYGDVTLGVHGEDFHLIFSYQTGGLESMVKHGKEWLYRTPKPTFWRATTDNDRGNGFPFRAGMWMTADMFQKCVDIQVRIDGTKIEKPSAPVNNKYSDKETAERVEVIFTYETLTVPSTQVKVSYLVFADGNVRVRAHYYGKEGMPELPAFGMRFVMPTKADGFVYEGLSGETYPDRKAGGIHGIYEVEGLPVTPYLVPQECGMHMDTEWVTVRRSTVLDNRNRHIEQSGLTFRAGSEINHSTFAFSCLPYTAEELENATHQEELPPERRTVLCIYGAVRGVGGIDSWGSDVEEQYRIPGNKDIEVEFIM